MAAFETASKPKIVSASTLAGYRVRSHNNEDLGAIEEILLDPETGRIAYAVLCFGGALGFGDRLFAIPWDLLTLNAADRALVLGWDHDGLNAAPAFQQDDWPDFGDESWMRQMQAFYGARISYSKAG